MARCDDTLRSAYTAEWRVWQVTTGLLLTAEESSIKAAAAQVTRGLGGNIAWPALLRKLDREQPDYKN